MKTALLALLLLALAASAQPSRFGLPACSAPTQELADRHFFLLWVAYELTPDHLSHIADLQLSTPGAT